MPKSSSPSPSITPMNPIKSHPQTLTLASDQTLTLPDDDLLRSYQLNPQTLLLDDDDDDHDPNPSAANPQIDSFSSLLFRDTEDDDDEEVEIDAKPGQQPSPAADQPRIDPSPHISSQFYTFNRDSHALMVGCILQGRVASPDEIRAATPRSVLASWRSVWKDRNEDTAYLTAWKRIQDKLNAVVDPSSGVPHLHFKSNPAQRVSHVDQWQDIVADSHADPDLLRHLNLKDTLERIKQAWTVGAKFYGIPESFIRVCLASCPICTSSSSRSHGLSAASRSKRRRFEYTESLDVPARDVPERLQQLAHQHKVVLCIRQKYIRCKPFMAEVKDYACHRAGEPASAKKAKLFKREPYQSKRCGCPFRIRAIVPITNYNEKDKTFVYQEEGNAVFKLFAVHAGHEPGPLDGSARIIHRVVGQKGGFDTDPMVYGVREEETEHEPFVSLLGKYDVNDAHRTVLQQMQELRVETRLMEGKITKMPLDILGSLSHALSDMLHKFRTTRARPDSDEVLMAGDNEVGHWGGDHSHQLGAHSSMFDKGTEIMEEEESDFGSSLGNIVSWESMADGCQDRKTLMRESCKPEKWMMKEDCGDFDEKSILNCEEEPKLIKPLRHDGTIATDPNLVGAHVDGFYSDNTKWYDSPVGLDPSVDPGDDDGFSHGGIV